MVNKSALCELGLIPVIWPPKDAGDIIRFMQRRSSAGMGSNDTRMTSTDNGLCQCLRKIRLPGPVVTHELARLVNCTSEYKGSRLEEDIRCKGDGHDYENEVKSTPQFSQGKGNKRPQEVEEVI